MKNILLILFPLALGLSSCSSVEILKEYDPLTGGLISEVSFKKGTKIREGESKFYENGVLNRNVSYSNNELNGPSIAYFIDGTVRYHIEYKSNRLISIIWYYSNDKIELDYGDFSNGEGHLKIYYPNGELFSSGNVKNGFADGKWILHSNGPEITIFYNQGIQDGRNAQEPIMIP